MTLQIILLRRGVVAHCALDNEAFVDNLDVLGEVALVPAHVVAQVARPTDALVHFLLVPAVLAGKL